ncbi:hypothetical protein FA13DRAFT_83353 [Coprinellus micaceus]|uniref:F-box domain-containing protein n=1 Tax=Coprinellus micaceus TaxID=71717 RepID=A0A4Y7TKB4_COPMI|nr:hypothetical protein FA13DRAFT_83353 [Coprinellus micaceus]
MVLKPPTQGVLLGTCQTLRVLNLEVPLEVYRDAVVPSDLFCPLLEELKIQVYTLYLTTNHENVLELMVAPLINRHSRTLTTLHLVDSRGPYRYLFYRYERLFRALTVFPRLSALSVHFLVYPIESRCPDALGRFIHLHHSSLHTLNLNLYHTLLWNYDFHVMRHHRLYDSSSLFRHGLFTRALPECSALTQLELVLLARDAFETGSAPLLSWFPTLQCTAKLTTLSLPYNTLTQSNLISLLNSTDLSSLRSLRVETRSFNMDLFDALAVTLHRLQDLRVDSHGLLDVDEDSGEEKEWTPLNVLSPDEPFLLELQARSYSHWCSLNRLRLVMIDQRKAYQHLKFEKVYWLKEGQVRHTFVHVRDFEATILPT